MNGRITALAATAAMAMPSAAAAQERGPEFNVGFETPSALSFNLPQDGLAEKAQAPDVKFGQTLDEAFAEARDPSNGLAIEGISYTADGKKKLGDIVLTGLSMRSIELTGVDRTVQVWSERKGKSGKYLRDTEKITISEDAEFTAEELKADKTRRDKCIKGAKNLVKRVVIKSSFSKEARKEVEKKTVPLSYGKNGDGC